MRTLGSFSKSNLFSPNTTITSVIETESYPKSEDMRSAQTKHASEFNFSFCKRKKVVIRFFFFKHLVELVSDPTPILIIEHFASVQRSRKEIVEKKKVMRNEHRLFHFACVNDVAVVESPVASPGQILPLTTGDLLWLTSGGATGSTLRLNIIRPFFIEAPE